MRTQHLYLGGFLILTGLAACNGTGNGAGNPADSTVTTTTTTTTVHHKYAGSFIPKPTEKYMDLKTRQEISVRIDTIRGTIVNSETDEPMYLFVEPTTHDTIYGVTGSVVNRLVIHADNGEMSIDTEKIGTLAPDNTAGQATDESHTGKVKYKESADGTKTKYKDEDVKVKEKNGVIKTKER